MILVDASVPRRFLNALREWGYSAERSLAYIPASAPDEDVIQLAQKHDAALLSIDLDFSNIIDYPPENFQGIIVLRDVPEQEDKVEAVLRQALADLYRGDLRQHLTIVSARGYRVRPKRYPKEPPRE